MLTYADVHLQVLLVSLPSASVRADLLSFTLRNAPVAHDLDYLAVARTYMNLQLTYAEVC
jgi:hypothetical protein